LRANFPHWPAIVVEPKSKQTTRITVPDPREKRDVAKMSEEVSASPVAIGELKYEDVSQLNFSKLYSPKMKSVYWRYFGFPSNDNNEVITKQNVVCIKCHKVLTNHGNTTNLRAHLQHRHKDLFKDLCQEHDIHVPPRKTPRNVTHPPLSKRNVSSRRVKLEFINNRNL